MNFYVTFPKKMFNFSKTNFYKSISKFSKEFKTTFIIFATIYTVHSINKETSKYGIYYKIENNRNTENKKDIENNKDKKNIENNKNNKNNKDKRNTENTENNVKIQVFRVEPHYYL